MTQTMDDLHCNNFSGCRKLLSLEHSAIVTSCSHIYCVDCATSIFASDRVCPACDATLTELDDLVRTNLRPSESWKSTILSGLAPSAILDCASRAFNFHSYQLQQGRAYDNTITKDLQERTAILEAELVSTQRDAAAEINLVKARLATGQHELDVERRRNHELLEMHKTNSKSYMKLKADFDKMKRQRSVVNSSDVTMSHNLASAPSPVQTRQAFVPVPNPDTRSHSSASQVKYRQGLDTRNESWNTSSRPQETSSTRPFQVVSAQGQGRTGGNAARTGHDSNHRHSTDGTAHRSSHQQHVRRSASDGFVTSNKGGGGGGGGTKSHFVSTHQSTGHSYKQQPASHYQQPQQGGVQQHGFRPASFSRGGGSE